MDAKNKHEDLELQSLQSVSSASMFKDIVSSVTAAVFHSRPPPAAPPPPLAESTRLNEVGFHLSVIERRISLLERARVAGFPSADVEICNLIANNIDLIKGTSMSASLSLPSQSPAAPLPASFSSPFPLVGTASSFPSFPFASSSSSNPPSDLPSNN